MAILPGAANERLPHQFARGENRGGQIRSRGVNGRVVFQSHRDQEPEDPAEQRSDIPWLTLCVLC